MAQVKHKQQYRSNNEKNNPQSSRRSKGEITIVDIREEVANDSILRLQKIGELLINARIRQNNEPELSNSPNECEQCLIPQLLKKASPSSH